MAFKHGKFRSTVDTHHNPTAGEKVPPASSPKEKQSAAHGEMQPEHVTKTHPGETKPHPETGVHAVHIHHVDGGAHHIVHTHHDGGNVETTHHDTAEEAHEKAHEGLPAGQHMGDDDNNKMGGEDFSESLGGIGGGGDY